MTAPSSSGPAGDTGRKVSTTEEEDPPFTPLPPGAKGTDKATGAAGDSLLDSFGKAISAPVIGAADGDDVEPPDRVPPKPSK